jgi:hypothetical protein
MHSRPNPSAALDGVARTVTFEKRGLIDVIDDAKWESVYGDQGTWKTGDGIALLDGAGGAFVLNGCKQIIMKDLARPATIPRARAAETGQKRIPII